jgi:transcriptional regulator with XRE-family HTH domain
MTVLESDFGTRLRLFRLRRAFTQADLAERSGVSAMTIIRLEANSNAARPSTVRKLAKALGVTPLQLTTEGGVSHQLPRAVHDRVQAILHRAARRLLNEYQDLLDQQRSGALTQEQLDRLRDLESITNRSNGALG